MPGQGIWRVPEGLTLCCLPLSFWLLVLVPDCGPSSCLWHSGSGGCEEAGKVRLLGSLAHCPLSFCLQSLGKHFLSEDPLEGHTVDAERRWMRTAQLK